jgi:NADH-quinone oxidoreductase subunit L
MGMHHDQDIRNMGGLRKYMKITWITSLIGSLALIGTPFLSGFYSKDSIIEAAKLSHIPGSTFAYYAVLAGVFVTAFYSFRMYFLVFHGQERWMQKKPKAKAKHDAHDDHDHHHGLGPKEVPHEQPWVVTLPLVLLAIPSLVIGYIAIEPMLFKGFFDGVIFVDSHAHPVMHELHEDFHGAAAMAIHSLTSLPFILATSGVVVAWFFYMKRPDIPAWIQRKFSWINTVLENKYGFDSFNEKVFAGGSRLIGSKLWKIGDVSLIDGVMVNGTANLIGRISSKIRHMQSGLIYHYAFAMIIGVFLLLTLFTQV